MSQPDALPAGGIQGGMPPPPDPRAARLPALREDLHIFPAASNKDGSPAWVIHDPVVNRFYRVGWLEFELLTRWSLRRVGRVLDAVAKDTVLRPEPEDLQLLIQFLEQQQLLRVSEREGTQKLLKRSRGKQTHWMSWLLHNYLFFRVPLVRPDRVLHALLPLANLFFSVAFRWATLGAAVFGVYLVARQWDSFHHTLLDTFTLEGMASYALALMVAKTLHELGHAFMAQRYGVRVAHMGFAFLVMWPVLYTDTSESWKLTKNQERFRIAAAGILTELALAVWATLGWGLAPDGPVKNGLFFLATTSWVISVGLNASPFMRFDGYYLLSDALDIQNLHERAGAFAQAHLRNTLLGWKIPDPEPMPDNWKRGLIAFSYITWFYRFAVFLGIAVAVYYAFFKALGIILFAVEIGWFVIRPIAKELRVWWEGREYIDNAPKVFAGVLLAAFLLVLSIPWKQEVSGAAWLRASQWQVIYSPLPAKLESMHGGRVLAGEPIAVLTSPEAASRLKQANALASSYLLQLQRTIGYKKGLDAQAVIAAQLDEQLANMSAESAELGRLELRAPFDGKVVDVDPNIAPGVWIAPKQPLGVLVSPNAWTVEAFIEPQDRERITEGNKVRFYPSRSGNTVLKGKVIAIDSARTNALPHEMLAAAHGGPIATLPQSNPPAPEKPLYRVRIALEKKPRYLREEVGEAFIQGEERALLVDWLRSIASVLIRESGF